MEPTRILVVEDETIVALDVKERLKDLGYEVTGVADRGEKALKLAASTRPDLVLMDIRLKGEMDGIALAEEMQRRWHVPIIYLTAFSEESTLQRAKVTEPFGYIIKPFEDREIQSTIEMALYKHRSEQRLRESEEKYKHLFAVGPDALLFADTETMEILEANDAAVNLYGYSREEFQELRVVDLSAEPEATMEALKSAPRQVPLRWHRRKDGTVFPVELTTSIFQWSGRRVQFASVRDITERRRAEEAVHESENLLQSIFRAAPTGIGVVSDRILANVNDRICQMTGRSREDLIGRSARVLYPSDADFDYVGTEKYRQIRERGTGTVETRWQCKDGRIIDVLMSSTPINPRDLKAGVTFTALDITERKNAERELQRSHQTFLTVLDGIDATVYVADLNTHEILFMNRHMIDAFGGDFTGRICHEVFRRQNRPCDHCTNDRLLDADGQPAGVCVWETRNPITERWYINYDRAIRWLDGQMVKLQIATDITVLKEMEEERNRIREQLMQLQKMESVGRLAGGVAHDFNNMLSAILGHAELGILGLDPADPIYGTLEEIRKAAQRSAELTQQLLAFARRQTVTPRVMDLNDTVAGMLKMLQRLIGEDIDILWMPGPGLWSVKMDSSQIDQILANLCVNSRDAIGGVGKLTIETRNAVFDEAYCAVHPGFLSGQYVMLAVSDDGRGMGRETLDHIFEPFFTTKAVGEGTGLGLATVYGIVKQNEGFINVYSELGKGSTFKIYLPRFKGETTEMPLDGEPEILKGQGETVLLVEDEEMILNVNTSMLQQLGYTVLTAGTPGEALCQAAAHSGQIRLLITDVVMPEMNGRDLAQSMVPIIPGLKCLFISGYTANVIAHRGVLKEGVHFLQKPFSMKELSRKVREVLDTGSFFENG